MVEGGSQDLDERRRNRSRMSGTERRRMGRQLLAEQEDVMAEQRSCQRGCRGGGTGGLCAGDLGRNVWLCLLVEEPVSLCEIC